MSKKETGSIQQAITTPPTKSTRKMHLKEFIAGKGLKREFIAGFKMYLNGVEYLSEKDWETTLDKYIHRK